MGALILRGITVAINLLWVCLGDRLSLMIQLLIPVFTVLLWGSSVVIEGKGLSRRVRNRNIHHHLWLLLVYYLALVMVILLVGGLFHVSRARGGEVNLELFHTIRNYWKLYQRTGNFESVSNLLGNVIILMPLGILLPLTFPRLRKWWLTVPILLAVAMGVEVLQYLLQSGTADVDDSFLNFLGAWLGYIATRTVQILLK